MKRTVMRVEWPSGSGFFNPNYNAMPQHRSEEEHSSRAREITMNKHERYRTQQGDPFPGFNKFAVQGRGEEIVKRRYISACETGCGYLMWFGEDMPLLSRELPKINAVQYLVGEENVITKPKDHDEENEQCLFDVDKAEKVKTIEYGFTNREISYQGPNEEKT